VRELENLVERELILSEIREEGGELRFDTLPAPASSRGRTSREDGEDGIGPLDDVIRAHIEAALARSDGQVEGEGGAARALGLHPSTLRGRMRKLGIPYGRKRREP
jgi:transcriptional regulator with GAF, ATPase, and Fis domain